MRVGRGGQGAGGDGMGRERLLWPPGLQGELRPGGCRAQAWSRGKTALETKAGAGMGTWGLGGTWGSSGGSADGTCGVKGGTWGFWVEGTG